MSILSLAKQRGARASIYVFVIASMICSNVAGVIAPASANQSLDTTVEIDPGSSNGTTTPIWACKALGNEAYELVAVNSPDELEELKNNGGLHPVPLDGCPEPTSDAVCDGDECEDQCNEDCPDDPEPPVTIIAYKIVCRSELDLPNWGEGSGPDLITASTAGDYVAASNGNCWFEDNWDFQYGFDDKEGTEGVDKLPGFLIGEADGTDTTGDCAYPWCGGNTFTGPDYQDWKTFGSTDGSGMTMTEIGDLEEAPNLWVREVLQEGFIPFTYPPLGATDDNATAEIYCHTDVVNFDNYDLIESPQYGGTYYCVAFNMQPVKIIATKIVCQEEADLPNWGPDGTGPGVITATTAEEYVAASNGACHLEPDWDFQWGFGDKEGQYGVDKLPGDHIGEADGTDTTGMCVDPYCGPNTFTGTDYENWKTFGSTDGTGTTEVYIYNLEGSSILWVREVLQEGFLPFSYPPAGAIEDDFTAEIYCHTDITNYDNYDYVDFIENPQMGETYYCVAFNTPDEQRPDEDTGSIEVCKYEDHDYNGQLDTGQTQIDPPGEEITFAGWFDALWGSLVRTAYAETLGDWPLPGWTIFLHDDQGELLDSAVTGDNGCVTFDGLPFGTYEVSEELPTGWFQTYPGGTHVVEIDSENADQSVYFLNFEPLIWGCKYEDQVNGNLLGGWQIHLEYLEGQEVEPQSYWSSTISEPEHPNFGCYAFPEVSPGVYRLGETQQEGWTQVAPDSFFDIEIPIELEELNLANPYHFVNQLDQNGGDDNGEENPGGPTSSASSTGGGGGGGGGGGTLELTIFNEETLEVRIPEAIVSWFTNVPATTRVVYDTVSHDGTDPAPNYGYAFSTVHDPAKILYHTVTLSDLEPGVTYYWRPISSASPEKMGIESSFVAGENPTVLGFTADDSATGQPAGNAAPTVLGFESLPDTGGGYTDYYLIVLGLFAATIAVLLARYRSILAK